jgi:hypothetical protein
MLPTNLVFFAGIFHAPTTAFSPKIQITDRCLQIPQTGAAFFDQKPKKI